MEDDRDIDSQATPHEKKATSDSWVDSPQGMDLSSAYAALLDQYREALARIHSLELQNQNLSNMVKWSPPPILPRNERPPIGAFDASDFAARVEAVERFLGKSVANDPPRDALATEDPKSESRDEVA